MSRTLLYVWIRKRKTKKRKLREKQSNIKCFKIYIDSVSQNYSNTEKQNIYLITLIVVKIALHTVQEAMEIIVQNRISIHYFIQQN